MTLFELQDVLSERIQMTIRDDLSPEERKTENEKTRLVIEASKQMLGIADAVIRAEKLYTATTGKTHSSTYKMICGDANG